MSESIQTVSLSSLAVLPLRKVNISGEQVRSIHINQLTGDFAVAIPSFNSGKVVLYPPNPNTPSISLMGSIKTLSSFSGYGSLLMPLDAKFDNMRGKLWIADAGNRRVLRINVSSLLADFSLGNIDIPHAVVPNLNNGGIFIKAFASFNRGTVYYYSQTGVLQSSFDYVDSFNWPIFTPTMSNLDRIPLSSTMCFDHRRSRLWWSALTKIFMVDLQNQQINYIDLSSYGYDSTRGLDVDLDSGNVIATAAKTVGSNKKWFALQIFRDNNEILSTTFLPAREMTICL